MQKVQWFQDFSHMATNTPQDVEWEVKGQVSQEKKKNICTAHFPAIHSQKRRYKETEGRLLRLIVLTSE